MVRADTADAEITENTDVSLQSSAGGVGGGVT